MTGLQHVDRCLVTMELLDPGNVVVSSVDAAAAAVVRAVVDETVAELVVERQCFVAI